MRIGFTLAHRRANIGKGPAQVGVRDTGKAVEGFTVVGYERLSDIRKVVRRGRIGDPTKAGVGSLLEQGEVR